MFVRGGPPSNDTLDTDRLPADVIVFYGNRCQE